MVSGPWLPWPRDSVDSINAIASVLAVCIMAEECDCTQDLAEIFKDQGYALV